MFTDKEINAIGNRAALFALAALISGFGTGQLLGLSFEWSLLMALVTPTIIMVGLAITVIIWFFWTMRNVNKQDEDKHV